jgi:GTPase involved in cell partitioning and DNA repair
LLDLSSKRVDKDYATLITELSSYKGELIEKQRIIVLNKADLVSEREVQKWRSLFELRGEAVVVVSALYGRGIEALKALLERQ